MMATRSLVRHKLYASINVVGLSVALTCAIFVILFVRYQFSYDKWIPGTHGLYRLEMTARIPGVPPMKFALVPDPLGRAMQEQIPGVTSATRISSDTLTLTHGDRQFLAKDVDFVDANFFRLIRLPFVEGDPASALRQPESVVLSQSAAREYFGGADPIGQTLTTSVGSCPKGSSAPPSSVNECSGETVSLRVTGIVRDLPENTQLTGSVFIPMASLADPSSPRARGSWLNRPMLTYITLSPDVKPATVLAAVPSLLDREAAQDLRETPLRVRGSQLFSIALTPFTAVHLDSEGRIGELVPPGSPDTLYGVITIGILVLLVACFNFTNLATARAALRAREIALRKMSGARRGQLAFQFLTEAVFLAMLSLVGAIAAAEILLPAFNGFLHLAIGLDYFRDWKLDLMLLAAAIGAGLVSGIYPALLLSRLRPLAALHAEAGSAGVGLRDVLVLMQFAVSIGLGIAALVVFQQVNYERNIKLGFRRDNIVVVRNTDLTGERQEAFAQALRSNAGVSAVGLSARAPFAHGELVTVVRVPGRPSQLRLDFLPIGPDYPRIYGIALQAGRLLSASRGDDRLRASAYTLKDANTGRNILVNTAGARRLGFTPQQAVGQTVVFDGSQVHIVGVLADARIQGARQAVAPTVYAYYPSDPMDVSVRLKPASIPQTLAFIDRTWHAFVPMHAIERSFLSASFEQLYLPDQREGTVFAAFVMIAIVIACLGLYGFVVFTAERRTKEVGIRKVSGARTADIVRLMLWRISVPVLVANMIAWPVAYYYLHGWLQGYAYRISLDPRYFLATSAVALLIAWATVYANTLRVARASPVHALRYE